ncbi:MAG: glycosyltransferase [Candidatus Aenigmatarchaeota archaeon]
MKVALLHDFFEKPGLSGGGENLAITVARAFKADVYTAYVHPAFEMSNNVNTTEVFPKAREMRKGSKTLAIMNAFEKLDLIGKYDLYIFSGTNCITAAQKHHPNLLYCHTPPRWLYDLREWFDANTNILGRVAMNVLRKKIYPIDQFYMRQFDKIITNSETVRQRLKQFYNDEMYENASVVYSFLELKKYRNKKSQGYYLSTARLDPLKRIDLIVKAFLEMSQKLYVISTGPMLEQIRNMADGHDNIAVLGWVDDKKMIDMLAGCVATIQMPINEDLGLGPMESMAAGKPCIAANEGGPAETVINGKTGMLIAPDVKSIKKAVGWMTLKRAESMKKACLARANFFSRENFIKRMIKAASEAIENHEKK